MVRYYDRQSGSHFYFKMHIWRYVNKSVSMYSTKST